MNHIGLFVKVNYSTLFVSFFGCSTPALIEFQASLPSNKLETLPADMKEMFAEIKDDKASEMNDTLEQIER